MIYNHVYVQDTQTYSYFREKSPTIEKSHNLNFITYR